MSRGVNRTLLRATSTCSKNTFPKKNKKKRVEIENVNILLVLESFRKARGYFKGLASGGVGDRIDPHGDSFEASFGSSLKIKEDLTQGVLTRPIRRGAAGFKGLRLCRRPLF